MHGVVFEHVFPLVYVLTIRKDQVTYTEIFAQLKAQAGQRNLQLQPDIVMTDFKMAAMNAVKTAFPDT